MKQNSSKPNSSCSSTPLVTLSKAKQESERESNGDGGREETYPFEAFLVLEAVAELGHPLSVSNLGSLHSLGFPRRAL